MRLLFKVHFDSCPRDITQRILKMDNACVIGTTLKVLRKILLSSPSCAWASKSISQVQFLWELHHSSEQLLCLSLLSPTMSATLSMFLPHSGCSHGLGVRKPKSRCFQAALWGRVLKGNPCLFYANCHVHLPPCMASLPSMHMVCPLCASYKDASR